MANYGYGVVIKNIELSEEELLNTVTFQELKQLVGLRRDMVIDVVRHENSERPKLQELINQLQRGDWVLIYSVDTFLKGNHEKAIYYYEQLLKKDITLVIYDFTRGTARISPFSSENIVLDVKDRKPRSHEELVRNFTEYVKESTAKKQSGGIKSEMRKDFSYQFKQLYFAYESYCLSLPDTLELLSKCCGIQNKRTFYLMCGDFESSYGYETECMEWWSIECSDFYDLPKRVGGLPPMYYDILLYSKSVKSGNRQERIEIAIKELGYYCNYNMFHRWELLDEKVPKPRKPIDSSFDKESFLAKWGK